MTPAQWISERAEEWAEWVEKTARQSSGYRESSLVMEYSGGARDGRGFDIDFAFFDQERCVQFNGAVNALPDHLRLVFKMHWLGSEEKSITVDTVAAVKAGHCGVSRAGYYRRLEEAYDVLYSDLKLGASRRLSLA